MMPCMLNITSIAAFGKFYGIGADGREKAISCGTILPRFHDDNF